MNVCVCVCVCARVCARVRVCVCVCVGGGDTSEMMLCIGNENLISGPFVWVIQSLYSASSLESRLPQLCE